MTQAQMNDVLVLLQKLAATQAVAAPAHNKFAKKDASILRTFKKRGFKDVVLMDRDDPTKPFNVRPYKGWLAVGRQVKAGAKSVKGLFHISQTDPIAPVA